MEKPNRRSIRKKGYDYTTPGAYFVTICTQDRRHRLGSVTNEGVTLSIEGEGAQNCWQAIPAHFSHVTLDEVVIMPNHLHGLLWFHVGVQHAGPLPTEEKGTAQVQHAAPLQNESPNDPLVGAQHGAPLRPNVVPGSLGAVIRSFKAAVTRQINQQENKPGSSIWQRNYYETIVRTEEQLYAIRHYIRENPKRWQLDRYNDAASGRDPLAVEIWQMIQNTKP